MALPRTEGFYLIHKYLPVKGVRRHVNHSHAVCQHSVVGDATLVVKFGPIASEGICVLDYYVLIYMTVYVFNGHFGPS